MPELKWRSQIEVSPAREYVVMASSLPLKRFWQVPRFMLDTLSITRQLKESSGLVWYSLLAHVMRSRFWTLSAWEEESALDEFAHSLPHTEVMTGLRPHMSRTRFVRWKVRGSEIPPTWEEALKRLEAD